MCFKFLTFFFVLSREHFLRLSLIDFSLTMLSVVEFFSKKSKSPNPPHRVPYKHQQNTQYRPSMCQPAVRFMVGSAGWDYFRGVKWGKLVSLPFLIFPKNIKEVVQNICSKKIWLKEIFKIQNMLDNKAKIKKKKSLVI